GMDIDLIARRRDLQVPAGSESALSVAELEGHSRPVVQPIHFAIAIEIDQGVSPSLPCNDCRFSKTQPACGRFIEPPFATAIPPRHLQIDFAIFIYVVR